MAMELTYTLTQAPNVYFPFTQIYQSIALWLAVWYLVERGNISARRCMWAIPHSKVPARLPA